MNYYLDASALVKVYLREKGTEAMVNLLNSGFNFFSSSVVYPEVLFTLRRKLENKEIDEEYFLNQVNSFEGHFQSLITNIEFTKEVSYFLKERVIRYSLRALDAIHLASALWIRENIDEDCKFICSDIDLLEVAKAERFELINPAK